MLGHTVLKDFEILDEIIRFNRIEPNKQIKDEGKFW